ncbi:hypothetical protein M0804_011867 [Polistes exclamans]|nr:hypothetical protein M0804_011867 [Polistes exclamans]
MLPITLNAVIMEDCKDRLMDVFTKSCGNDRLKRGIEKFDLKKEDYKKFKLAEFIDHSLEEQKQPISFIRHEKQKILTEIANSKDLFDSSQENTQKERRHFPQNSLSSVLVQPYDAVIIRSKFIFE